MTNKQIVEERLRFLAQIEEVKENFRGPQFIAFNDAGEFTHTFKHFAALRNYLCLTCFDILGQPDKWLHFEAWLISTKTKDERAKIFEESKENELDKKILEVYKGYNAIYGVKNSFNRFIDEVISAENKSKLLETISAAKQKNLAHAYPDGKHTSGMEEPFELDEAEKKKLLFNARNSFTHKGTSFGNDGAGIFSSFENPPEVDGELFWPALIVIKERKGDDLISYKVKRWPFVLIEIIEDTLKER